MPYSAPGPFLGAQTASAYQVSRSLRFRSSASAYLSRTPASAGNRQTWTWSGWVKRGTLGTQQGLFGAGDGSANASAIYITPGNALSVYDYVSGAFGSQVTTTQVFRDTSAWYHIVVAYDTTQATNTNRIKIYINGSQISSSAITGTYPSLNYASGWINSSTYSYSIGREDGFANYFDGYLAEVNFIDGQALTPSSFGQSNALTGVWEPKAYTGSYGTNGFYLPFSDNSSATNVLTGNVGLGKDSSGNGNYWTTNNISLAGSTVTSFTSTGTTSWTAPSGVTSVRYLVVAGGGGGGGATTNNQGASGAGGGGGGVLTGTLAVTPGNSYTVSVGTGGSAGTAGSTNGVQGGNGGNSVFDSITAIGGGGGGGGHFQTPAPAAGSGANGGSGGGQGGSSSSTNATYGTGTSGQGNNGGTFSNARTGNGGGGAGAVGGNATGNTQAGNGGAGIASTISGSSVTYGGGGGGGAWYTPSTAGTGGSGGGGAGSSSSAAGTAGTANTGGGGGGGYSDLTNAYAAGAGGSGIVILTYGSGTTYDSMIDSPTLYADGGTGRGNYATLNPLFTNGSPSISSANLNVTGGSTQSSVSGTIGASSGKYYAEFIATSIGSNTHFGVFALGNNTNGANVGPGQDSRCIYRNDGGVFTSSQVGTYASYTTSNTIGVALNLDASPPTVTFYKDNTSQGTVNLSTSFSNWTFAMLFNASSDAAIINFGQRPFTYTPPSGFSALNTQNLPTPTIANGAQYMAAVTYSGDSNSSTVISPTTTNSGNNPLPTTFQPDFVWIKNRSNTGGTGFGDHMLYDVVRGTLKELSSNATTAEGSLSSGLSAFNTTGFTPGTSTRTNETGNTYVGWQWNAGGAPTVDNTAGAGNVPTAGSVKINGANSTSALAGSIAATRLSANTSAGFSVVTYTGTGTTGTVGHGLGAAPGFIIIKRRTGSPYSWPVYHSGFSGGANDYLILDGTQAKASNIVVWNNTNPTSSVFSIGTDAFINGSGAPYVAYCFAPVAGYSAFGSYTGNGSTDGPFVYTGFRPRYLLIKRTDSTGNWNIIDTSRSTYNVTDAVLWADLTSADAAGQGTDILSNGFKLRSTGLVTNASSGTYIYAAFAEVPFKIARAR